MNILRSMGRLRMFSLLMVMASFPLAVSPVYASDVEKALRGFDDEVTKTMEILQIPGAAIGVIWDGKVVLAKGYGVVEAGTQERVDADTTFAVASLSKSFTAAVTATLVDEGKVEWDKPVRDYLPWFRMHDPIATELTTLRDMLAHRTGLASHQFLRFSTYMDRAEYVRRIRYLPSSTTFRNSYEYNNPMYVAAGYVAGEVAGSTWEELVKERIFRPLGMSRSNTSIRESIRQGNYARPHGRPQLTAIEFYDYETFGMGPNGSVNSTVNDYLRYLDMYLHDGKSNGQQVLSASQIKQLFSPVHPNGTALGWTVGERHGVPYVEHSGSVRGFGSQMYLFPGKKFGIVAFANRPGGGLAQRVSGRLIDRFLGVADDNYLASLKPISSPRPHEVAAQLKPIPRARPSRQLSAYAGAWFHPAYGRISVEVDGNILVAKFDALSLVLDHFNYDSFSIREMPPGVGGSSKRFVKFHLDEYGEVSEMLLPLESAVDDFVFLRAPATK